jgi:hypothetical protein
MVAVEEGLRAEVERARSDYLAVSRNGALYGDPRAHQVAEERAWDRLQSALRALEVEDTEAAPKAA